jgi:hypothetical protein
MIASVGSSILGSGTSSTLTFSIPCHVNAFIRSFRRFRVSARLTRDGRFDTGFTSRLAGVADLQAIGGHLP